MSDITSRLATAMLQELRRVFHTPGDLWPGHNPFSEPCNTCTTAVQAAMVAGVPLFRAQAAEQIAQAIETAEGRRCPECGGAPASLKWSRVGYEREGRCGGGHRWTHRNSDWSDPAAIAREHGQG